MTKIELAKLTVSTIVGVGTSKIVHTTVKNNVRPETTVDAVTVTAGSYALGAMVSDASRSYTDAKIDELVIWWKTNITKN